MASAPRVGVGLGYRHPLHLDILRHRDEIDFVEVLTDAFARNELALQALSTLLPCIPHSLRLSVGSSVQPEYLKRVERVVSITRPPWHTDHLAFTHAGGISAGHLVPVQLTRESLERVEANVRLVQDAIRTPFALENITKPFLWPGDEMEEHEFLGELVKRTGCGLLLDLENVRINAVNHGVPAHAMLDRLPLEAVFQVHLAGGTEEGTLHKDTHNAPVPEETWRLFERLCELVKPPAVMIERDGRFPPFRTLLEEVRRARRIWEAAG